MGSPWTAAGAGAALSPHPFRLLQASRTLQPELPGSGAQSAAPAQPSARAAGSPWALWGF